MSAQALVEHFDEIVKPDGGSVSLLGTEGGTLRIAYSPGRNEECPTCIIEPEALGAMIRDMLADHAPELSEVKVEPGAQP